MSETTTPQMKGEVTITFMMASANVFDHKKKRELLQSFASLSPENQQKLERLVANAQLDEALNQLPADDCSRLKQIAANRKALEKLKDNWMLLKATIGA